jgi:hypothetical protein
MPKHVSDERKVAYYVGMALQILGGLLFASPFVTFLIFGDFTDFGGRARSEELRVFGGIALLIIGGVIRDIAAKGLAGSGVLLDPERARHELEPYSRMAGGMVKDAIDATQLNLGGQTPKEIMLKCRACGGLSTESAKFCQECGTQL